MNFQRQVFLAIGIFSMVVYLATQGISVESIITFIFQVGVSFGMAAGTGTIIRWIHK